MNDLDTANHAFEVSPSLALLINSLAIHDWVASYHALESVRTDMLRFSTLMLKVGIGLKDQQQQQQDM